MSVDPRDVLHFAKGMLWSLFKLVERCPDINFRESMKSIGICDLARTIKYFENLLKEEAEKKKND